MPVPPLSKRSDTPFFNRGFTKSVIADIAYSRRLVVYVGSGVTIDESGIQWTTLITSLAKPVGLGDEMVERLSQSLNSAQLASVITQRYKSKYPGNWKQKLIDQVRTTLYPESRWRRGRYARSLILMCASLLRSGADISIITTNYDTHLEIALETLQGLLKTALFEFVVSALTSAEEANPSNEALLEQDEDLATDSGTITFIHVHGIVSELPSRDDSIVFSENDYIETEELVRELLLDQFSQRDVLIVGSSLDDPPVLRALLRSKAAAGKLSLSRWAIIARESFNAGSAPYSVTDGSEIDLVNPMQLRADQLGLQLITPDFFSQASQLPREISDLRKRFAGTATLGQLKTSYQLQNYKTRLDEWWTGWKLRIDSAEPHLAQVRAHNRLRKTADDIRDKILRDPDERVRVDLWMRWSPDDRSLSRWASSTGSWFDPELMPRLDIEASSPHLPVQVFTAGSSKLQAQDADPYWARAIGVAITTDVRGEEMLVGVAVLRTHKGANSLLSEERTQILIDISESLFQAGRKLLQSL